MRSTTYPAWTRGQRTMMPLAIEAMARSPVGANPVTGLRHRRVFDVPAPAEPAIFVPAVEPAKMTGLRPTTMPPGAASHPLGMGAGRHDRPAEGLGDHVVPHRWHRRTPHARNDELSGSRAWRTLLWPTKSWRSPPGDWSNIWRPPTSQLPGQLVGEGGFEPPTSCSQSRCATTAPLPGGTAGERTGGPAAPGPNCARGMGSGRRRRDHCRGGDGSPLHSRLCEDHRLAPRGEQGQALR